MKAATLNHTDASQENYQRSRIAHWNAVSRQMDTWTGWGGAYHRRLEQVYRSLVRPGLRVLEVGCARADLLAALSPSVGVGVDFSHEMFERAAQRHPELRFVHADAHDFSCLDEQFDVIILSDLINDLWDVQAVFQQLEHLSTAHTRIVLNFYSRLWEPLLALADRLGLAKPTLHQNWLTVEDTANLLNLNDFEVIRHWAEVLWPLPIPLLNTFANRYLVKVWPFTYLALTNFIVAKPRPLSRPLVENP